MKAPLGIRHLHFDQIDSTNAEAKRQINSGTATDGMVITTDWQTNGVGQYDRPWSSERGQNIMMTLILKPNDLKAIDQFYLNMVVGVALQNIVAQYADTASIKWPNDIYIGDKKVAGILIQNYVQGAYIKSSIIGMGINVGQKKWPSDIPNPTSLEIATQQSLDRNVLLAEILEAISKEYKWLLNGSKGIRDRYHMALYQRGGLMTFEIEREEITATIKGIDEIGRLIIDQPEIGDRAYRHDQIRMIITSK